MLTDPVCGKHMNHNSAHIIIGYEGTARQNLSECPKNTRGPNWASRPKSARNVLTGNFNTEFDPAKQNG